MNRSDDENDHGLVAETYDLFRGDEPVEQEAWFQFYKRRLEERGCASGRIKVAFCADSVRVPSCQTALSTSAKGPDPGRKQQR
jgi:hypothetical protein